MTSVERAPASASEQAPSAPSRGQPIFAGRVGRRRYAWLAVLLAALSGVAVAVAFPPYGLVWLLPFGLAGFMVAVRGRRGRGGFAVGFAFGLGAMLVLLQWITVIGYDAWIGLSVGEACFFGLLGVAWAWMRRTAWWPLGVAAAWVGEEWLRSTVPFGGLPWGRIPFALVDTPFALFGRVGGTALVSFLVVGGVALVVYAAEGWHRRMRVVTALGGAVAIVAVSFTLPAGAADPVGHTRIAAVQGNVPGEGLDPFVERRVVLNNHASATHELADRVAAGQVPQPDLVIWPESSTDIDPFASSSAYAEINRAVRAIGVPVLVGASVHGPDADHLQNMGIVWSPTTGPGAHYVKQHLVPFGEYVPFRDILTNYIHRLNQIPLDFSPGHKPGVLQMAGVTIGDAICFEVAYDDVFREVVDGGAQVLVIQTNNATYAGTGQLAQQWQMSRYRAIEAGRAVVVASTDGISGIVSPDGSVVEKTKVHTQAVVQSRVPLASGVTLGIRIGGWVTGVLAVLGLLLTGLAYFGRRRASGTMRV